MYGRYVYLIRKSNNSRTNSTVYSTIREARMGALRSYKHGQSNWIDIYKIKLDWGEDVGRGLYLTHKKPCETLTYDGTIQEYIIQTKTNTNPEPRYIVNKDGSLGGKGNTQGA